MRRLALLLLLWPAVAAADDQPPPQEEPEQKPPDISTNPAVNEHFHDGLAAYQKRDYKKASREFETAYKLDPLPVLLFTWAQSERLGGHCDKAVPLYNKYLYADINAKQKAETRDNIQRCGGNVEAPKKTDEPDLRAENPRWYKDKLGGGLTIAGVVGIGVGVAYLVKASGTRSDADGAMFLDDFKSGLDEATTQRRIGAVSLTLGLGLVASGIAVYVIHDKQNKNKLVAGTDGRTVFIGARF
jgi:tetratricopeptide (TPR) repeat protein